MTTEILIKKIESLSNEDRKEVINFIDYLENRKNRLKKNRQKKTTNIEDEKFIGMWKDRVDLADSSDWVRRLRKTDWID